MQPEELQTLRTAIDEIDEGIVRLLGERFRVTAEVGLLKARLGLAAVDPQREADQARRFSTLADAHGVPETLVQEVFRQIIDEVVRHHRKV